MNQWRSKTVHELEDLVLQLSSELENLKKQKQDQQQQFQMLKIQNERLLKMEAQHQIARKSLLEKRIVFSRAEVLFPENMVIGDRLENCTLKVYKGNSLTVGDTAELINCRIIGLDY